MIQRIQTVYYLIAVALLTWVSLGQQIVSFHIESSSHVETVELALNSLGVNAEAKLILTEEEIHEFEQHITSTGAQFSVEDSMLKWKNSIPVFILFAVIILLTLIAIFSFKNQKRQLRLGRIAFLLNLLVTAGIFILILIIPSQLSETASQFMMDDDVISSRYLGLGFYLLCASIPFIFLGNIGVKRDLDLLKSLDRLR